MAATLPAAVCERLQLLPTYFDVTPKKSVMPPKKLSPSEFALNLGFPWEIPLPCLTALACTYIHVLPLVYCTSGHFPTTTERHGKQWEVSCKDMFTSV